MNEAYAEWLVKRKTPAYAMVIRPVMVILTVFSVFLALTTVLGVAVMFLVGFGTYLVFRNLNIEFEYIYVTGQLTIDKIMGRAKRKKVLDYDMENIQIVAPSDSYLIKDHESGNMKVKNYSSGRPEAKTYTLVHQLSGETTKVIFEPNEKLLQCMRQNAPRKVII